MKSVLFGAAVMALAVTLPGNASAQASNVEVKIPFAFMVQSRALPAGEYVIEQAGPDVLLIHGEHGTKGAAYVLARPDSELRSGNRPELTFTKHENEWRLTSVDDPGIGENMVIDGVHGGN
jgi:hypothetical protein